LFASISKEVSENDTLSLGLRLDNFEKALSRNKRVQMPAYGPFFYPAQDSTTPTISRKETFSSFSPSLQWEHSFSEELTGNGRVTYAEKPGGFSAYADNAAKSSFVEEETMAFELSILFSPSASWGVNLTAYLNDIENYQFELPDPTSTDYYVDNADEVTAKGIEIEGFVKPAESVTFSVAYGLCDSEYDKFSGSGLAGKQVSFVPKQTLALSAIYQLNNGVYGQIGTKTIGDTHYWDYDGLKAPDKIDSYTLLDANIGYDFNSWEVSVFGLNLTDEEYYTSLVNNLPGSPGIAGSPRVVGLSISREF
jgi:iron complex outermembrane receptor protein